MLSLFQASHYEGVNRHPAGSTYTIDCRSSIHRSIYRLHEAHTHHRHHHPTPHFANLTLVARPSSILLPTDRRDYGQFLHQPKSTLGSDFVPINYQIEIRHLNQNPTRVNKAETKHQRCQSTGGPLQEHPDKTKIWTSTSAKGATIHNNPSVTDQAVINNQLDSHSNNPVI